MKDVTKEGNAKVQFEFKCDRCGWTVLTDEYWMNDSDDPGQLSMGCDNCGKTIQGGKLGNDNEMYALAVVPK